jgi:hypothetical protein
MQAYGTLDLQELKFKRPAYGCLAHYKAKHSKKYLDVEQN